MQFLHCPQCAAVLEEQARASPCAVHAAFEEWKLARRNKQSHLQLPFLRKPKPFTAVQVKWLRTIEVLDTHSTNHYHRHDNKVCDVPCSHSLLGSAHC